MSISLPPDQHDYLLFSDVHLGADLVQHARPWTVARLREVLRLDRDLAAMLDHYRASARPGRPWRLIIAGDLVDFVGMSIAAIEGEALARPMDPEERDHGLGCAEDRAAYKMRAVVRRHRLVFERLAAFVADGHSLVIVRGNHDVEFYWEAATNAFVEALLEHAGAFADDAARDDFLGRIEFRPWFYYVEGLLYVEHGHQYDANCAYHHHLAPLSPRDPNRIDYSFSDVLLRYIVRPTRGMSSEGHENKNLAYYLTMAFSMGVGGCARLGYRFFRAVFELVRRWRAQVSEAAQAIRVEHERRMTMVADRFRLSLDKLATLASFGARPVTGDLGVILSSVFLDVVVAGGTGALGLTLLGVFGVVDLMHLPFGALALVVALYVWMRRSRVADARDALRAGAARVAQLLPARFVVMGHTHLPLMERLTEACTYVNLGGWAVDDLEPGAVHPAPYTHLVIRHVDGEPRAELLRWDPEHGPQEVASTAAISDSGLHRIEAGTGPDEAPIEAA
jgi:UDP-2,3-diacylglucosamine pyrophosphatase LpxH